MIEFLLSNHPLDCPVCDKGGECELPGYDLPLRPSTKTRFTEEKVPLPRGEVVSSGLLRRAALHPLLSAACAVCDEGMDVKALGVGARRAVGDPAEPARQTRLRRMRHVHRHLPCRRALTSGTYRYQTRPWEIDLRSQSLRALLERLQDDVERPQQRNSARQQSRPFRLSTANSSAARAASDTNLPAIPSAFARRSCAATASSNSASWEDALEEVARRLKQVHATQGSAAIGVIGSNHTTNEENYLL